jgi:hypothetical protein
MPYRQNQVRCLFAKIQLDSRFNPPSILGEGSGQGDNRIGWLTDPVGVSPENALAEQGNDDDCAQQHHGWRPHRFFR